MLKKLALFNFIRGCFKITYVTAFGLTDVIYNEVSCVSFCVCLAPGSRRGFKITSGYISLLSKYITLADYMMTLKKCSQ